MLIDKEKLIEEVTALGTQVEVGKVGDQIIYRPKTVAVQQVLNIINNQEESNG